MRPLTTTAMRGPGEPDLSPPISDDRLDSLARLVPRITRGTGGIHLPSGRLTDGYAETLTLGEYRRRHQMQYGR